MYKAILRSFGWSLLLGVFIFCVIHIVCLLLSECHDSEFYIVFVVLYGIYIFIQLTLSVINLAQVHFFEKSDQKDIDFSGLFERFLIAEMILYFIVFLPLSMGLGLKDASVLVQIGRAHV